MENFVARVVKSAAIVGTLDILAACTYFFIKTGGSNPVTVLRFVASGFFGKAAFTGGNEMAFAGLLFHYFIALTVTVIFFFAYPKIEQVFKNKVITGVLYGIMVWIFMTFVVVRLSTIPPKPLDPLNAVINACILIICIGIPLSFMADSYYRKQRI